MSEAPRFELPPPAPAPRRPWWLIAAAMFAAGATMGFFLAPQGIPDSIVTESAVPSAPTTVGEGFGLSAAEYRELAERLERNQLFAQAAQAWQAATRLDPPREADRAQRLFRIGKNLSLAGRHDEALTYLFAAEAADPSASLKGSMDGLVLEALSALGLEDVRAYQALNRATLTAPQSTSQPAGDEVARIGNEPITQRDLNAFARRMIEQQMGSQRMFLTDDAFENMVETAMDQFETPQGRNSLVQMYLRDELLYREALSRELPDRPAVRQSVAAARRGVLIQVFLDEYLRQTVRVDETGIRDAYEADKSRYVEPEAVRLEAVVVDSEDARREVTAALHNGEDFATVRDRLSIETAADLAESWFARSATVPGVRDSRAALAHLFTLEAGSISDRWFEGDGRWYRLRVVERRPARQLELDECRDQVERDLRQRKQQEAFANLQAVLAEKYEVSIAQPTSQPAGPAN